MIKANELRIGNIFNYTTSENEMYTTTLDWQDIKWISEDEKGFNLVHDPIPLTEEWLLKFKATPYFDNSYCYDRFKISYKPNYKYWYIQDVSTLTYLCKVEFVHEWQNLVFVMNSQELEMK